MIKNKVITIVLLTLLSILLFSNISIAESEDNIFVVTYKDQQSLNFYLTPNSLNLGYNNYIVINPYNKQMDLEIINSSGTFNINTNATIYRFNQSSDFYLKINNMDYGNIRFSRMGFRRDMLRDDYEMINMRESNKIITNTFLGTIIGCFYMSVVAYFYVKRYKEKEIQIEEI